MNQEKKVGVCRAVEGRNHAIAVKRCPSGIKGSGGSGISYCLVLTHRLPVCSLYLGTCMDLGASYISTYMKPPGRLLWNLK